MFYYSVEHIVFCAWLEQNLPYPRGHQIGRKAVAQGMAVAIGALKQSELIAWINRRDWLESELGTAFRPDPTLKRIKFYEHARARLNADLRPALP